MHCDVKVQKYKMSDKNDVRFISKSQDEDSQMMTEVDLFISTKAVKVLNADTQVSNSSHCVDSVFPSVLSHHSGSVYINVIMIVVVSAPRRRQ